MTDVQRVAFTPTVTLDRRDPLPPTDEVKAAVHDALESIDPTGLLRNGNLSTEGNAECLALLHGDKLRYDHQRCMWLMWNGEIWEEANRGQAERLAVDTVRTRYRAGSELPAGTEEQMAYKKRFAGHMVGSENNRVVKQILDSACSLPTLATDVSQWDSDPYLANAGDVTIDLRTATARPNSIDDYITKRMGTRFDPEAVCPNWELFLAQVHSDHPELTAYLQRAIGYSMTGDVSEQVFFLCIGNGSNGKSVLFNVIGRLLGDYAGATDFSTFDADTSEARGDLAKLRGTRLVTIIETDEDKRLAEARIKVVTGKDRVITARALYEKPFDYRVTFKIWMAMNHLPTVRGTDKGIWRRIQRIDFMQTFEGSMDDKHLEDKLIAELPGILNWALAGLYEWHKQGLNPPPCIREAINEYRTDSDMVGQWLDSYIAKGDKMTMDSILGYKSFTDYCTQRGIMRPMSHKSWSNQLKEHNITKPIRKGKGMVYVGIGLCQDEIAL